MTSLLRLVIADVDRHLVRFREARKPNEVSVKVAFAAAMTRCQLTAGRTERCHDQNELSRIETCTCAEGNSQATSRDCRAAIVRNGSLGRVWR